MWKITADTVITQYVESYMHEGSAVDRLTAQSRGTIIDGIKIELKSKKMLPSCG